MSRIYLIRHGRPSAAWGESHADPGLDEVGEGQSRLAAETLLALPSAERPVHVASSPMLRCRQTALPLARALRTTMEIVEEVSEIPTPRSAADRGSWLGRALRGHWSDIRGDVDYSLWRGLVLEAVSARPGTAIFTHFVAINAVVSKLQNAQSVTVFRPGHASITILEAQNGGLKLLSLGSEAATGVL